MSPSTSPLVVRRAGIGAFARGISLASLLLAGSVGCSVTIDDTSSGSGGSDGASSSSSATSGGWASGSGSSTAGVGGATVTSGSGGQGTTGSGDASSSSSGQGTGGAPSGSTSTTSSSGEGGADGAGGSGAAPAGTGGSGDPPDEGFQPCPKTGPCKILPLGDSITFGLGFDGGYRVELFRLARKDGHEITFTGTQQPNGPSMVDGAPFPRNHEGISGETIQQIANRVPTPALREMPHIVLLHAGTNDMYRNSNGADSRLGGLIDELIAEAPDALIVVSNIIPFPAYANQVNTYNATIPKVVEERAKAGAHVIFVDQFKDFPSSELGDGVHPNQAGYARMARVWYSAISEYLR